MTKKVLIIDDSDSDRKLSASIVKKLGHSVIEASSGEEGFDLAKENVPDLIILDIVMHPDQMDGYATLRKIKKEGFLKQVPVIIFSSKGQKTDIAWGKAQGARDYMTKPLSSHDLIKEFATKIHNFIGQN